MFSLSNITISPLLSHDAKDALIYLKLIAKETSFLTFGIDDLDMSEKRAVAFYESLQDPRSGHIIKGVYKNKIISIADIQRPEKKRLSHCGELSISALKLYWGTGVSSKMFNSLLKWAQDEGLKRLSLIVREDNLRALRFYKKLGFVEEGKTIDSIYVNGYYYNEYIMAKYLK